MNIKSLQGEIEVYLCPEMKKTGGQPTLLGEAVVESNLAVDEIIEHDTKENVHMVRINILF